MAFCCNREACSFYSFAAATSMQLATTRRTVLITIVCLLHLNFTCSMTISSSPVPTQTATPSDDMRFGKFLIPSSHIFYRTPRSAAFVNLRPIVPGHVLIMPERIVATMEELSDEEYLDLWVAVRRVQKVLQVRYPLTTAFNVAVQDGLAAGQSVPHVHVHILPRSGGDFERNDDVYTELEEWAPRDDLRELKPRTNIDVPDDAERVDRTYEMMEEEAAGYRTIVQNES